MSKEVREDCGEKLISNKMVDEIMQVLAHNEDAAYMIYLKLAIKFGAGQKLS